MSERNESLYLKDILDSINAIGEYTSSLTLESFLHDRKSFQATVREFEIIGEAVKNLSVETLKQYTEIEWRDIIDFRNILIHEYFGIDGELVWNVICDDLPNLKSVVNQLLKKYQREVSQP
jgi:uncharacterized protein with HEPN domain